MWIAAAGLAVAALVVAGAILFRADDDSEGPSDIDLGRVGIDAPAYGSVDDIASRLAGKGIECARLRPMDPTEVEKERATCRAEGDQVVIRIFSSAEDRNHYLETAQDLLDQVSVEALPRILGPAWMVTAETDSLARKIAEATGGELLT
jgi:hypothetical protein